MQNVRPAYIQLITGFGVKWGEKKILQILQNS